MPWSSDSSSQEALTLESNQAGDWGRGSTERGSMFLLYSRKQPWRDQGGFPHTTATETQSQGNKTHSFLLAWLPDFH